jgi:hypothetical protein
MFFLLYSIKRTFFDIHISNDNNMPMFRLFALIAAGLIGYKLGSRKAGDLTQDYIVSRQTLVGNLSTIDFVAVGIDGSTNFVSNEADATKFTYNGAISASNFLSTAQTFLQPIRIKILPAILAPTTI